MKQMRKCVIFLLCSLLFLCDKLPVQAQQHSYITFEGDKTSDHFTFGPGSVNSASDLFTDLGELMPGDEKTQTIRVNNRASANIELVLFVKSEWASDTQSSLLENDISITFTADGNSVDFDTSPVSQEQMNGWVLVGELNSTGNAGVPGAQDLSAWTYLGTLHVGGTVDVNATVRVPITIGNTYEGLIGKVDILVQAEANPDSRYPEGGGNGSGQDSETGDGHQSPGFTTGGKTGDTASILVWLVLIAVSADILFWIWKKRREKRDEQ